MKLVGVKVDPATQLTVSRGSNSKNFKFGDDFVATTGHSEATFRSMPMWSLWVMASTLLSISGTITRPGRRLPRQGPDDHGQRPARDRRGTEPFGGKALTYYGRWTYKYEEAARRGAAGVILIHTNESAGYGWNVGTSFGGPRSEIHAHGAANALSRSDVLGDE